VLPPWWAWPAALALAALLFWPGAELTYFIMQSLGVSDQIRQYQDAVANGAGERALNLGPVLGLVAGLSLLQAICEELAFRGFILSGLRRRFTTWKAVFLSSFLFALFHMNVFQFAPHFILGIVLGLLTVRTASILPAVLFHFTYNCLIYLCLTIAPALYGDAFARLSYDDITRVPFAWTRLVLTAACLAAAAAVLAAVAKARRTTAGRSSIFRRRPLPVKLRRPDLARERPS
jgi:hypothetical protein